MPRFLFHRFGDIALTLDQRFHLLADSVRRFLAQSDGLLDRRLSLLQLTKLYVARRGSQVGFGELVVDEERVFAVSKGLFEFLLLQVSHCSVRKNTFLLLTLWRNKTKTGKFHVPRLWVYSSIALSISPALSAVFP